MKKRLSLILLSYFRFLARCQLRKNKSAIIIGITGSAGKTSTRLALVKILQTKGKVKHSSHANSESGIPLNILGITPLNYSPLDWLRMAFLAPLRLLFNWERFNYYVVEMGIDSPAAPKNMTYLLTIIRPHVAVLLNAGVVHGAEFDYLVHDRHPARRLSKIRSEIAKEKLKLAESVDPSGVVVINLDEASFRSALPKIKARVIGLGKRAAARLRILRLTGKYAFSLTLSYQSQTYKLVINRLLEPSYAYTFSAAIAAAAAVGIPPGKSVEVLKDFVPPRGRLRIFAGINDTQIIDSSYNASPDTMLSALKLLNSSAGKFYKLAILGDMRELGIQEKIAHKNLADWIILNADECLLFGPLTEKYTLPVLLSAHFPVRHFRSMAELNRYTRSHLKPSSWVLVKGSQNTILLERAVENLLSDPKDAGSLARRGQYWDRVRARTP